MGYWNATGGIEEKAGGCQKKRGAKWRCYEYAAVGGGGSRGSGTFELSRYRWALGVNEAEEHEAQTSIKRILRWGHAKKGCAIPALS